MSDTISATAAASQARYTTQGYALLIGVEAYDNWPEKRLRAGRNDALAFWKVCRRLGFSPENIRVLTSPKLDVDDIVWAEQEWRLEREPPMSNADRKRRLAEIDAEVRAWFANETNPRVTLGEATYEALFGEGRADEGSAVNWLAARRSTNEHPATRLLTYSGHGAVDKYGNLALCPRDVGRALESAVLFNDLSERLKEVDENLTIVLDCCFAEPRSQVSGAQQVSTLSTGSGDHKAIDEQLRIKGRVFCASGRRESSYQALLTGYWYGAFTWALTTALEQWQLRDDDGFKEATLSHTELLFRARMLLSALSFRQQPVLIDAIGNLPVFNRGLIPDEKGTDGDPNEERPGIQLDPSENFAFTEYSLWVAPLERVALIIVPKDNHYDRNGALLWDKTKEYWYVDRAFSTNTGTSWRLTVTGRSEPSVQSPGAAIARSTTWTPGDFTPDQQSNYPQGAFDFGVTASAGYEYGKYSVTVTWFNHNPRNLRWYLDQSHSEETDQLASGTAGYKYKSTTTMFRV